METRDWKSKERRDRRGVGSVFVGGGKKTQRSSEEEKKMSLMQSIRRQERNNQVDLDVLIPIDLFLGFSV